MNGNRAPECFKPDGPGRLTRRLRRKIQTERNAELALRPVGVFGQFCSAQVRSKVNVRRLDRLTRNRADRANELVMKEARHTLVVGYVAQWIAAITQTKRTPADPLPVVTA